VKLPRLKLNAYTARRLFAADARPLSAIGSKWTFLFAPRMSAFGGEADISRTMYGSARGVIHASFWIARVRASQRRVMDKIDSRRQCGTVGTDVFAFVCLRNADQYNVI